MIKNEGILRVEAYFSTPVGYAGHHCDPPVER